VGVLGFCWAPGQVVVEVSAELAVQTFRVVFAHAAPVDLTNHSTAAFCPTSNKRPMNSVFMLIVRISDDFSHFLSIYKVYTFYKEAK